MQTPGHLILPFHISYSYQVWYLILWGFIGQGKWVGEAACTDKDCSTKINNNKRKIICCIFRISLYANKTLILYTHKAGIIQNSANPWTQKSTKRLMAKRLQKKLTYKTNFCICFYFSSMYHWHKHCKKTACIRKFLVSWIFKASFYFKYSKQADDTWTLLQHSKLANRPGLCSLQRNPSPSRTSFPWHNPKGEEPSDPAVPGDSV